MPAANQAFREITFRELTARGYQGEVSGPQKGHNEMTLSELRREEASFAADGEPRQARQFAFTFHLRFALAVGTLALASLLLAAPFNHRGLRGLIAFAACFLYLVLLYTGEALAVSGKALPPVAAAWLPNVVLIDERDPHRVIVEQSGHTVRLKPDTTGNIRFSFFVVLVQSSKRLTDTEHPRRLRFRRSLPSADSRPHSLRRTSASIRRSDPHRAPAARRSRDSRRKFPYCDGRAKALRYPPSRRIAHRFGAAGLQLDCRLPIADCRLPTADYRLPTADYRLTTTSRSSRCSASHRATASTGCDFRAQ